MNTNELYEALRNFIIDIVFLHSPELFVPIWSTIIRGGSVPKFITYTHWLPQIEGKLVEYQNAEKYIHLAAYKTAKFNYTYSEYNASMLDEIFRNSENIKFDIIYPPFKMDTDEVDDSMKYDIPTFLFNSRASEYTGYSFLKEVLDKYDEKYSDKIQIAFSRIAQNVGFADKIREDFKSINIINMKEGEDYREFMKRCHYVLGLHSGKSGFSISVMDGINAGLMPVFYNGAFFPEIFKGFERSDFLEYCSFKRFDADEVADLLHKLIMPVP
ncbi:MAG: hypothetical protein QW478_14200, partial [Candidatus Micrarchaeaceae archaeon]